MTDSVQVTTELSGDTWLITASVTPGGVLPLDIFTYENTGEAQLGRYVGVCNLNELKRLQVWQEVSIPKFGNRFVRTNQAKINLSLDSDPSVTVNLIVATAKTLKTEIMAAASTTTVYPI